jgi:hypothetical protein
MDQGHAPERRWPDDEPVRDERAQPPRSRRGRIVRALGDVFLTAGIGRAIGGSAGRDSADVQATTNVILFGEGEAKGREASRGSRTERR